MTALNPYQTIEAFIDRKSGETLEGVIEQH
jgi:hypothetical protein